MKTTIILADSQPFRALLEIDLESAPLPGEHTAFGGRVYQVIERSWRFETDPADNLPDAQLKPSVGLLVRQVSGPPHVVTALGGGLN